MKSRGEVTVQLVLVRALLAKLRADDVDEDLLYGAQQALIWMLGEGQSPSDLWAVIEDLAEKMDG